MAVYLLSYDIINERKGTNPYKELWDALGRAGAHRTLYSGWLIASNLTPRDLVEEFKRYLDNDDRIWVTRVRPSEHWYTNAIGGTNNWLARNPPD